MWDHKKEQAPANSHDYSRFRVRICPASSLFKWAHNSACELFEWTKHPYSTQYGCSDAGLELTYHRYRTFLYGGAGTPGKDSTLPQCRNSSALEDNSPTWPLTWLGVWTHHSWLPNGIFSQKLHCSCMSRTPERTIAYIEPIPNSLNRHGLSPPQVMSTCQSHSSQ